MSTAGADGLSIRGNFTLMAPSKYLGLQLNSYKQKLIVTVSIDMFQKLILNSFFNKNYNVPGFVSFNVKNCHVCVDFKCRVH